MEKVLYTVSSTAIAGREGRIVAMEPVLNLQLSVPKGLGGPGGSGTNPEQLFASGYAACFGSALGHVARTKKLQTGQIQVTAKVTLGTNADGNFQLAAELDVALPEMNEPDAWALIESAHQVCPYSRATRGNIEVQFKLSQSR